MTSYLCKAARSILPIGLAGLAFAAQVGAAKAEVNDGFFGALSRLFAPPPQPRYAPPVFVPQMQVARPRRSLRTRHASLPGGATKEKVKAKADKAGKPTVRDPNGDAVSSALNDPTLRRGDIVVLPSGPKVFKGGANAPYRLSDFDDLRHSKLLGDKTRRDLMALRLQPAVRQAEADKGAPPSEGRSEQADNADSPLTVTVSMPRKVSP